TSSIIRTRSAATAPTATRQAASRIQPSARNLPEWQTSIREGCFNFRHESDFSFGVRRQSAAATALWMSDKLQLVVKIRDRLKFVLDIQSAVAAALCRRTPNQRLTVKSLK